MKGSGAGPDLAVRRLGAQSIGFSDVCLGPLGLTSVLRNGECYRVGYTREELKRGPDRGPQRRLGKALPEPFGAFNTHYPITGVGEPSLLEIIR